VDLLLRTTVALRLLRRTRSKINKTA